MKKTFYLFLIVLLCYSQYCRALSMNTVSDISQVALPLAAAIKTLSINDQEGMKEFLTSFAISSVAVYMLKEGIHTERPNGGLHSFPSGHTTVAFLSAAYLQRRYGWAYGIPAYALAAFVGYTRIITDNHWPTDVLAGAALGTATSYLFTTPFQKKIWVSTATDKQGTYVQISLPLN